MPAPCYRGPAPLARRGRLHPRSVPRIRSSADPERRDGTRSHLAVPGRPTTVCGEPIEGGDDLGVLTVPARDNTAPACMACTEIWSTWRGVGAWEGDGPPPGRFTSREW